MVKKRKGKRGMKVGQTKITMRKINGKRTKVRVTKKSGGKYSVKKIGARKKR